MTLPPLIKFFFSSFFQAFLLLIMFMGVALYFRFPHFIYDNLIENTSNFLKTKYGTGGSITKIDNGFHKLALLVTILCILGYIFLQFWKWLLNQQKSAKSFFLFPANSHLQKKDWAVIASLIIVGVLLRIFSINQSLWQDEIGIYNTFIHDGIFSTIFPKNSMGSHPLMQIIVALFINITGVNEFTLRFPVFLTAILSIPLIYFMCLKISGKRMIAIIATGLLTIHSYHIYYSFQMRGYVILVFLCILSTYFLIKILSEDNHKNKILIVVINVLIVYTHLYAIYCIIAQQLVIIGFALYQKYRKEDKVICLSQKNVIAYFHSFIISILIILLLYLPQFPVIFMNILDTTRKSPEFSIMNYFYSVIVSSNVVIAYSNHILICYIYAFLICLLFIFFVKKTSAYQLIFNTGIILFLVTALIPSGSGFFARYLICEVPLFIIISAIVLNELWLSEKKLHKSLAIILAIVYLTITIFSFPKTYQPIQDYKGAVEYIHNNRKSDNTIIISNSLGKTAVTFYDKKIIPLFRVQQFDSLMILNSEIYAISTFENFLGSGSFFNDKEIQTRIEKKFKHIKTFDGEFPVNVWHHE